MILFIGEWYLETNIWVLGVPSAVGVSLLGLSELSWDMYTGQYIHTHLCS
jgi:hypothetical protein